MCNRAFARAVYIAQPKYFGCLSIIRRIYPFKFFDIIEELCLGILQAHELWVPRIPDCTNYCATKVL